MNKISTMSNVAKILFGTCLNLCIFNVHGKSNTTLSIMDDRGVSEDNIETFDMRYYTSDIKANGDTDFYGDKDWFNLEQRLDVLCKFAEYAAPYWGNPNLDKPLLKEDDINDRLSKIKELPITNIRKTIRLESWKAYGYSLNKGKEQEKEWNKWNTDLNSGILNGCLVLNKGKISRQITNMNWRFKFKTRIKEMSSDFVITFQNNKETVFSINFLSDSIILQSWDIKKGMDCKLKKDSEVEIYCDISNSCFFVTVDNKTTECVIANAPSFNTVNEVSLLSLNGITEIDEIYLYNFVENPKNRHTPFSAELCLNEDFENILPMNGWQNLYYDDTDWKTVELPSVHGGLQEKGESYFLRRKVKVGSFERANLKLETLDPGGEIWINGMPVAVINNRHPYNLDVTEYLIPNANNIIAVRVKPYKANHQMLHSPSDPYTGWFLGRTELLLTSKCMIKDVFAHTSVLSDNRAIQKNNVILQYSGDEYYKGSIEINYYPWFPFEDVKKATITKNIEIRPKIDNSFEIDLDIDNPLVWSTDNPSLYKVEVILKDKKGKVIDDYIFTTGIRTIEQKNGNLYINNKVEMLNGAQILGYRYPIETVAKTNRCVDNKTIIRDLLSIKEMNGNMLRIHVHAEKDTIDGINDPRYAEYADQLGVYLLWQTAGWIREGEAWNVDFEGYPKFMKQVYNHPSIVMWEASNHPNRFKKHSVSDTQDYMELIYNTISKVDTSRLISPTSFWQHTHYGNYDGSIDYKGNKIDNPSKVLMEKMMTRGSQDAYSGYGAKWSSIRKAPHSWAASCLKANDKAYFNFEHEESAAQPNWELSKKEPWYRVQSYEWEYEEGSIGRKLDASEWRISQAFQAFSAWESMKKQILIGYDGFSWCSIESGANMFTYQKPLIDPFGVPKLAFYANKQVFNRIWAASDDCDVVYGPNDKISPVIFNLGDECTVNLYIELKDVKGKVYKKKSFKNIFVDKGRSVTRLTPFQFDNVREGCYFINYKLFICE